MYSKTISMIEEKKQKLNPAQKVTKHCGHQVAFTQAIGTTK